MPKITDPIPSRSFTVRVVGDELETLMELVNESNRLKPEWHDSPQTIINSIVEDFLSLHDAFDQFILTRVDSEQRALLRKIAELKGLKRAVRDGTLEDGDELAEEELPASSAPTPPTATAKSPPLDSVSPAVR